LSRLNVSKLKAAIKLIVKNYTLDLLHKWKIKDLKERAQKNDLTTFDSLTIP